MACKIWWVGLNNFQELPGVIYTSASTPTNTPLPSPHTGIASDEIKFGLWVERKSLTIFKNIFLPDNIDFSNKYWQYKGEEKPTKPNF